jgi:hypothetical protein
MDSKPEKKEVQKSTSDKIKLQTSDGKNIEVSKEVASLANSLKKSLEGILNICFF